MKISKISRFFVFSFALAVLLMVPVYAYTYSYQEKGMCSFCGTYDAKFFNIDNSVCYFYDVDCPNCGIRERRPSLASFHKWIPYQDVVATCTSDGFKSSRCQNCGIMVLRIESFPALGHDWAETSRTAATCTIAGTVNYTCSVCNETKSEPLAALGHDWQETSRKNATCTASGTIYYSCSCCTETKTETIPQLATDHT